MGTDRPFSRILRAKCHHLRYIIIILMHDAAEKLLDMRSIKSNTSRVWLSQLRLK